MHLKEYQTRNLQQQLHKYETVHNLDVNKDTWSCILGGALQPSDRVNILEYLQGLKTSFIQITIQLIYRKNLGKSLDKIFSNLNLSLFCYYGIVRIILSLKTLLSKK